MAAPSAAQFQLYRLAGVSDVWWRAIRPNGRAIATAVTAMPSVDEVVAHLEQLATHRLALEPTVRVTPTHRWRWQLALGGEVVARGASDQDRRVRCDAAWRSFVHVVAAMQIEPTVHVFTRGMPVRQPAAAATDLWTRAR